MSFDLNEKDIELLHNNQKQLILDLQGLIDIVINQFIGAGKFIYSERHEIKQHINVELLNRITKIQDQYQGKSLLRTYLSVVIRNICNEIVRNKTKLNHVSFEDITIVEENNENSNSLIFEEEIFRLRKIFGLYYKQKNKLILCLKLKFKMIFNIEDFRNFNINITQSEFEKFVDATHPYFECSDSKIFEALISIFNKYEHKENTSDSLRKWVADKINDIIEILNGNPPTSKYDKETLQILFEKCYYRENKMNLRSIRINA